MQLDMSEKITQYAGCVHRQMSGTQGQKMGCATHAT